VIPEVPGSLASFGFSEMWPLMAIMAGGLLAGAIILWLILGWVMNNRGSAEGIRKAAKIIAICCVILVPFAYLGIYPIGSQEGTQAIVIGALVALRLWHIAWRREKATA